MNRCNSGRAIACSNNEVLVADKLGQIYNNTNYKIRNEFQYRPMIYYIVVELLKDNILNNEGMSKLTEKKLNYIISKLIPFPDVYGIIKKEYNNLDYSDVYSVLKSQILYRKLLPSWQSYFALKGKGKRGHPGYLKNDNIRTKMIICPKANYTISDNGKWLTIGKKNPLKFRLKWKPQWKGEQQKIELIYDEDVSKAKGKDIFKIFQSVKVESPNMIDDDKYAYVDLGMIYPITVLLDGNTSIQGNETLFAYSSEKIYNEWKSLSKEIERLQSIAKTTNNKNTTKRINKLMKLRTRKRNDSIDKIVHSFVELCADVGNSKIVMGDLTNILVNSESKGKKVNKMLHNYWSPTYLTKRIELTAENYGIEIEKINERGTSSKCPRCGETDRIIKRGRLFKCNNCKLEAHRDVIGTYNIRAVYLNDKECLDRVMAHPKIVHVS